MSRTLVLTREAQNPDTDWSQLGYRIRITAGSAVNVNASVFRYSRRKDDPLDADSADVDVYSGVCTAEEMSTLPVNNPDPDVSVFFRKDTADRVLTSQADADAFWALVQERVLLLLQTLDYMDVLTQQGSYTATTA